MTEAQLQHECVMWFNATHRKIAHLVHIPNARKQSKAEGARWRGLGVLAGWPDLQVVKGGRILLIELKTDKGVVSAAQTKVHKDLTDNGTEVVVVRSLEEFVRVVEGWLGV